MEFWNDIIIDKSWRILQELRKKIDFVLIGGWAVFFLTKTLKSKDIDIIIDLDVLDLLKKEFVMKKNDFLKRYEIGIEGVDIDIYVPYYSKFIIPVEEITKNLVIIENFKIPRVELLLLLKQQAEIQRKDSIKGQKDRIDIISLLINTKIDWHFYKRLIKEYKLKEYQTRLKNIIISARKEYEFLNIYDLRKIKLIKQELISALSD